MNSLRFTLGSLFLISILLTSCESEPQEKNTICSDIGRPLNTVITRLDADPDRINPLLSTDRFAYTVYEQIFQFLLVPDPSTMEMIPQLVKSRAITEDITDGPNAGGVAYTFEIHDAAVWDDGSPVTGNDYVFTLKAVLNPHVQAQRLRPYLTNIRDVNVDEANPKKFTVITSEKYIVGEEAVGNTFPVLPAYNYDPQNLLGEIPITSFTDPDQLASIADENEALKTFATNFQEPKFSSEAGTITGSGPYKFEEWITGDQINLSKKTNWWGDQLIETYPALEAFPERLVFKPISNAATALAALKAGEIDVISNIDPKDFSEIQDQALVTDCYTLATPPSLVSLFFNLNTESEKLQEPEVRRAIAHAVDVNTVLQNLYFGFGERTATPVMPSLPSYNKDLPLIDFDIEKSKSLLQEAGWKDSNNNGTVDKEINGETVELELKYLLTANREISRNLALMIQNTLNQVGIKLNIVAQEFRTNLQDFRSGNYDMGSAGTTVPPTWDPKQVWHTSSKGGGSNYTGFGNAETDALIDKIRMTLDIDERMVLYKEMQKKIYDETPRVYMFVPTARVAIHNRFDPVTTPNFPNFVVNKLKLK